jgi:hypothetical protein
MPPEKDIRSIPTEKLADLLDWVEEESSPVDPSTKSLRAPSDSVPGECPPEEEPGS